MKYNIPNNLLNKNFECDNCGFISNCFTFNQHCIDCDCYEYDDEIECWKQHITNDLKFQCNCKNAEALENNLHCTKCDSKNLDVIAYDDSYEATCQDCNNTDIIAEAQAKKILEDDYYYIDESELNAAIEKEIIKDTQNSYKKIGRNDPCPCGSGKKYKNCHGK